MDELTAVKASRAGDKGAFGVLIDQYYKNIYRYAYQYTGNHQDADDICQETFLQAFNRIMQLKNSNNFRGWIFTIATNLCRKHLKTTGSKKTLALNTDTENLFDKKNQPLENLSTKENTLMIQQQLQQMSEHLRMVAVLVLMEDNTQKEVAKILNRSEPSISRDLDSVKKWLQSRLKNIV